MNPLVSVWGLLYNSLWSVTIPDSIHYNSVCASFPTGIANTFSYSLTECFNCADASNTPIPKYNFSSSLSCFSCSSSDVLSLVQKLDNNSAAGSGGITSRMMKNTATSILSLMPGRSPVLFLSLRPVTPML